jgi:spermidine synthase
LSISTNACKGLENAVKEVFPHVEQRECFKHMMQNYVKRFPGGAEHMFSAARAYIWRISVFHNKQFLKNQLFRKPLKLMKPLKVEQEQVEATKLSTPKKNVKRVVHKLTPKKKVT